MTDVERQYARAVFSLALEKNLVDEVYKELNMFITSLDDQSWKFFLHPKIDVQDKHQLIDIVIKNKLLINFLKVVIDNNRFDLVKTIAEAYLDLINEMNQVIEVDVFSNLKINEVNIEKIKRNLEIKFMKKVIIKQFIDSSIIGGIRIEYQGCVIDQTINSSLDKMKKSLTGGN
ncbi:MAG: ATP synthase F1 subunit delta [Candidatus Izemoplasmatales bacterium]